MLTGILIGILVSFAALPLLILVLEFLIRLTRSRQSKLAHDHLRRSGRLTFLDAYDDPEEGLNSPPWEDAETEYNTYLGFAPKASFATSAYQINRYHFRYVEDFPVEKAPGEIRIFVTGGSKAWGAGVTQEKLYTRLLEERFQKIPAYSRLRVICAAGGAYCTTQERIMIENVILRLSPDYVVMFSGRNDCYFGYIGKDIMLDQDYFKYRRLIHPKEPSSLELSRYDDYSFKLHFLFDRIVYHARKARQGKGPATDVPKDARRSSIDPAKVIETFFANVHIVSDISRRYGFKLIFYLEPSIFSSAKPMSAWEQSILARTGDNLRGFPEYNSEIYDKLREMLGRDAHENSYLFLDGDAAISDTTESVFSDNVHFGDRGYELIATHMLAELREIMNKATLPRNV
jgi:hypothetical protein